MVVLLHYFGKPCIEKFWYTLEEYKYVKQLCKITDWGDSIIYLTSHAMIAGTSSAEGRCYASNPEDHVSCLKQCHGHNLKLPKLEIWMYLLRSWCVYLHRW
jgi:hypothetical protein